MSTSTFKRGKKKNAQKTLAKLAATPGLTPDGADWLTLRLDPFHDFQRQIAGYPDADSLDTIVSCFNYEQQLSKPAGAAANWDAHIFTLPFTSCSAVTVGTIGATGNFVASANTYTLGMVNVAKADAGQALFPNVNPVVATNFEVATMSTFDAIELGCSRVIGFGIEVIDTSSVLNKQGALVAYRMPNARPEVSTVGLLNAAGTLQTAIHPTAMPSPPATVAEAIQYKSSVTWEAKEGCYMAVGQVGVENEFRLPVKSTLALTPSGQLFENGFALATLPSATTAVQVPPLLTSTIGVRYKHVNCSQNGIFLSGLANDATFKIRVRVYVERAPNFGDVDLIPLATKSPPYDTKALEAYAMALQMLPVAVPVGFNAKGDWWRWVLRAVAAAMPVLGNVLSPLIPGGGAIGTGIGSLAGMIEQAIPKARSKKVPVKQNY